MLPLSFVPEMPFDGYKWRWASVQCTESINDPVVLLGVLFRMRKLEGQGLKYSSEKFQQELSNLEKDISDSMVSVNLSARGGERNLIRNSGQYWKALGLIPDDSRGYIELTEFGREVADRTISQSEFAAITIRTFRLPNPHVSNKKELDAWRENSLEIFPLQLILTILRHLYLDGEGWMTPLELARVVIPLAGSKRASLEDYVNFIRDYRMNPFHFGKWPRCTPDANDMRMVREYLLFLENYGYLTSEREKPRDRFAQKFIYNAAIDCEIAEMLSDSFLGKTNKTVLAMLRDESITAGIESKRVAAANSRPEQAAFRRKVLEAHQRCVITNALMPEVLQAAHIKPHKYNGPESVDNGFPMRIDIHRLFDTGHLRIAPDGQVELSTRARLDYGSAIPPRIVIPPITNRDFLRWRWENYDGL